MHTQKGRTAQNLLGERCCCCCGFVWFSAWFFILANILCGLLACLLVPQQDFLILVCSLFSIHFTQSVLKFHIQNINFTIMNIIAITVFIHFSPHLLLRTYMVSRMTCVYHYIRQIWNQIKEKGRKVHHHQREKTKEWKTKRIWNVCVRKNEERLEPQRQGKANSICVCKCGLLLLLLLILLFYSNWTHALRAQSVSCDLSPCVSWSQNAFTSSRLFC